MADPDIRVTSNLHLSYPAKDLDPWDDKYIEQMDRLDVTILFAMQSARLAFVGRKIEWDTASTTLTINGFTMLCPIFGGVFTWGDGATPLVVPADNYVLMNVPEDIPWDSTYAIGAAELFVTPTAPAAYVRGQVVFGLHIAGAFVMGIQDHFAYPSTL